MKASRVIGWALTALIAAFLLLGSASGKFLGGEGAVAMYDHIGWTAGIMLWVGVAEVACVTLFLVPRSAFLGAVLLTAYLGGATAAHVRIGDAFFVPVVLAVFVWCALGLRDPRVFVLALGGSTVAVPKPTASQD